MALLVRRRDHEPLKFMGHDLKQFKSLEGEVNKKFKNLLTSYFQVSLNLVLSLPFRATF